MRSERSETSPRSGGQDKWDGVDVGEEEWGYEVGVTGGKIRERDKR